MPEIWRVEYVHHLDKQIEIVQLVQTMDEELFVDGHCEISVHGIRFRTVQVACFRSFPEVPRFELRDDIENPAAVAHGRGVVDMVSVKEPVTRSVGIGISHRVCVRVFSFDRKSPSSRKPVADDVLEGHGCECPMTQ